jgi:hypothetical protein
MICQVAAILGCPWYFNLFLVIPLNCFNFLRFVGKDHKLYFLTTGEYKKDHKRINCYYTVKAFLYGFICAVGLVMTIIYAVGMLR